MNSGKAAKNIIILSKGVCEIAAYININKTHICTWISLVRNESAASQRWNKLSNRFAVSRSTTLRSEKTKRAVMPCTSALNRTLTISGCYDPAVQRVCMVSKGLLLATANAQC